MNRSHLCYGLIGMALLLSGCAAIEPRATGDLGVIIERATGSVQIVERAPHRALGRIEGLGDLSHASLVYSRDARHAFVFGRDGGLSKIDLLRLRLVARVLQAGNSIGGAISQDGRYIAVANYEPGGLKIFDAETLTQVADIPSVPGPDGKRSKVVGIADAPGNRFVFSLFEAGEIWVVDMTNPSTPGVTRYPNVGKQPYDALISPDGRYYIAGLFGENGLAVLDLWHPEQGVKRILADYGKGEEKLPVYKMPHLRGWAMANGLAFLPGIGRHEVLVVDTRTWQKVAAIPVHSQPVFVMARPDARQIWVNFAFPDNDTVQVIDVATLKLVHEMKPGKAILHMEFSARGGEVWISARDSGRVAIYDTASFARLAELPVPSPSGIFFTWRAHRIGL